MMADGLRIPLGEPEIATLRELSRAVVVDGQ
jgi:hypothetical protein